METAVRKQALGVATNQLTFIPCQSDYYHRDKWYDAYCIIKENARLGFAGELPGLIEIRDEDMAADKDWKDVLNDIHEMAEVIEDSIKACLEWAKDGLAEATNEHEITEVMSTCEMSDLVDIGASLELSKEEGLLHYRTR